MRCAALILFCLAMPVACSAPANADPTVAALERLVEAGNPEATYFLGMAYQTGTGVKPDHHRALEYFRKAAELGDPLAAYKVGCFHAGQDGVLPVDPDQALRYKRIAADAGYALAQQDVAMLEFHRGDRAAAMHWLERAAAQGSRHAMMAYASANNSDDFERRPAITAAYFELVLDRGGSDQRQRKWLADFRATLSDDDRREAGRIVRSYRPRPTALTLKALSGVRAAQSLAAGASSR